MSGLLEAAEQLTQHFLINSRSTKKNVPAKGILNFSKQIAKRDDYDLATDYKSYRNNEVNKQWKPADRPVSFRAGPIIPRQFIKLCESINKHKTILTHSRSNLI